MKLIAYENLFNPIIDFFVESEHDVLNLKSKEFSGIYDDAIKNNLIIITDDGVRIRKNKT